MCPVIVQIHRTFYFDYENTMNQYKNTRMIYKCVCMVYGVGAVTTRVRNEVDM